MKDAILGGALIGTAVSIMLYFNGKITGISGILGSLLRPGQTEKKWRVFFLAGLLMGGAGLRIFYGTEPFRIGTHLQLVDYIVAGFLVGFGTLLGNGCTSGHGVCGISRFSTRSLTATVTFVVAGVVSVYLFRVLRGEL